MPEPEFKDHFSGHAGQYQRYRPRYPRPLFDYLAARAPDRTLAWDCATGNGQAAAQLGRLFNRVVATDASARQIEQASGPDNVEFRTAPAAVSALDSASVDLITVAQALHWFDFEAFYTEARRVLKPGGILAAWCYGLFSSVPEVDAVVRHLYRDVVGSYWPPERHWIDEGYQGIPFPFPELSAPQFAMRLEWTLEDLSGYLDTWSASRRYHQATGNNAVATVAAELQRAWPRNSTTMPVTWVLRLRVGRHDGNH